MRRRGFTLIELSTVIVILALFAAAMVPTMSVMIETSKRRSYRINVLTLVKRAKVESVTRGQTMSLSCDDGTFQLGFEEDGAVTPLASVAATQGIEASHFYESGEEVGSGEWTLSFFPDGTSEGGAFQFDEANDSKTVRISKKDSKVAVSDGAIDPTNDTDTEWDAGGYEQSG